MDEDQYKQLAINPDYEAAWATLCDAESAYAMTVSMAFGGANNWKEINDAKHAVERARMVLESTPKYISVSL